MEKKKTNKGINGEDEKRREKRGTMEGKREAKDRRQINKRREERAGKEKEKKG